MNDFIPFNLPDEIKILSQWVGWKYEKRTGQDKPTKPPYQIRDTSRKASATDPKTWASFAEAVKASDNGSGLDGIGLVFTKSDPYVGIDLDRCRTPETETIENWAQKILDMFPRAYAEITPSGTGLHLLIKGRLPGRGMKRGKLEVYGEDRYFTMTGQALPSSGMEIPEHQAALNAFLGEYFKEKNPPEDGPNPGRSFLTDDEVIKRASASKQGGKFKKLWAGDFSEYPSQSEADSALCMVLAFWCGKNLDQMDRLFRASGLYRSKWGEKHGAHTYGQMTLERAAALTTETFTPAKEKTTAETPDTPPRQRQVISGAFPDEVMTGLAGAFAQLYSAYLEPCAQFFYMSFLTCLGSILTGLVTLDSSLNPQSRLFTLLLGESADDRKSTAIKEVVRFFQEFLTEFTVCWGVGSAEGLQSLFEQHERVLLLLDEFKYFVSKARIDGSVLLPATTTLFESNTFESHTKTKHLSLNNAHLSILAASTAETYQQTWSPIFTDIGFGNRLWIVPGSAKRRFSIPQTIPDRDIATLKNHLGDILAIASDQTRLPIEHAAHELFHDWYMTRESSIHQKRLDTYGHRLMVLLAINEGKSFVDVSVMEKVITLLNWQYDVRRLYDPIDADNNIAKMEERIRRALMQGDKNPRALKRATHANREGIRVFNWALDNLKKENEIRWDKDTRSWCLIDQED